MPAEEAPRSVNAQRLSMVERTLALKTFAGFAQLPARELALLASICHEQAFTTGEVMLRPGTPVVHMFLIIEGEVQMYSVESGDKTQKLGPRSSIGGLASLAGSPTGASAKALSEVFALAINSDDMQEVFEDSFAVLCGVLEQLAKGIRAHQMRLAGKLPADTEDYVPVELDRPLTWVERIFFLRRTTQFSDSNIEAMAHLAADMEELRMSAGEPLWQTNDHADYSLLIVRGGIECTPPEGESFSFPPGWIVGGLDSLSASPRWYSAKAAEDNTVLLRMRRNNLLDVLEDHPRQAAIMLRILAGGLEGLIERAAQQPA